MFVLNVKGVNPRSFAAPVKSSSSIGLDHPSEVVNAMEVDMKFSYVPKCIKKPILW